MSDNKNKPHPHHHLSTRSVHEDESGYHAVEGWSGPLPSPEALDAFERIEPGSAKMIMLEFQSEASHRRIMEVKEARLVSRDAVLGRVTALAFAMGGFAVIAFGIDRGATQFATIFGGGMLVSGMVALIGGRK